MLESAEIARLIVAFIFTVFVIIAIYYGLSRYGKPFLSQKGIIKILDVKYLGKGISLIFVEVKNKQFFLSVSDKEVKILEKWEKEEKKENLSEKT